jgi:hypothetical protein
MLGKIWDLTLDYLKEKGVWGTLRPIVIVSAVFLAAHMLTLQYLKWQYEFSPPLWLYVRSFYFQRIVLVFVVVLVTLLALRVGPAAPVLARWRKMRRYIRIYRRAILYRTLVLVAACLLLTGGFLWLSPRRVTHISIKLMDEPARINVSALAFLVYELNRRQRTWFFEIDFEPLNPEALTSVEQKECKDSDRPLLCYAERWAAGRPAIVITEDPLGLAYFCEHRGSVSVVSTADRDAYAPLTDYEFLMYSVIVQSAIIHLDQYAALPAQAFKNRDSTQGGVFQFNPRKDALKSMILAASLSPTEEQLLLNEFGPEYTRSTKDLLSMRWLYSQQVTNDLQTFYSVKLSRTFTDESR